MQQITTSNGTFGVVEVPHVANDFEIEVIVWINLLYYTIPCNNMVGKKPEIDILPEGNWQVVGVWKEIAQDYPELSEHNIKPNSLIIKRI